MLAVRSERETQAACGQNTEKLGDFSEVTLRVSTEAGTRTRVQAGPEASLVGFPFMQGLLQVTVTVQWPSCLNRRRYLELLPQG